MTYLTLPDAAARVPGLPGVLIQSIKTALRAACRRAGVRCSAHDFKRTAVSWFFRSGGTMERAEEYFDTSGPTLRAVYRQHSPAHQAGSGGLIERSR